LPNGPDLHRGDENGSGKIETTLTTCRSAAGYFHQPYDLKRLRERYWVEASDTPEGSIFASFSAAFEPNLVFQEPLLLIVAEKWPSIFIEFDPGTPLYFPAYSHDPMRNRRWPPQPRRPATAIYEKRAERQACYPQLHRAGGRSPKAHRRKAQCSIDSLFAQYANLNQFIGDRRHIDGDLGRATRKPSAILHPSMHYVRSVEADKVTQMLYGSGLVAEHDFRIVDFIFEAERITPCCRIQ
jgi:hypothetical protein